MERKELESKILKFVSSAYRKPIEGLSMDTNLKNDLGGTSLLMVGLVSLIENELDVLVPLPTAAACKTIEDLVNEVAKML
jgi:acyl carrier protein